MHKIKKCILSNQCFLREAPERNWHQTIWELRLLLIRESQEPKNNSVIVLFTVTANLFTIPRDPNGLLSLLFGWKEKEKNLLVSDKKMVFWLSTRRRSEAWGGQLVSTWPSWLSWVSAAGTAWTLHFYVSGPWAMPSTWNVLKSLVEWRKELVLIG